MQNQLQFDQPAAPPSPPDLLTAGMSTDEVRRPYREEVYAAVEAHPRFRELKACVDRHLRRLYGPEGVAAAVARQDAETYLTYLVMEARSSLNTKMGAMQREIAEALGLPLSRDSVYRGHRIDWMRLAVGRRLAAGQAVEPGLAAKYGQEGEDAEKD